MLSAVNIFSLIYTKHTYEALFFMHAAPVIGNFYEISGLILDEEILLPQIKLFGSKSTNSYLV